MALTSYNRDPVLCRHLVERGAFAGTDFHFFDVGVSGGIERLNGLGLVTDTHEAAFVGCHDYHRRHTHAEWWTPEARSTQFFPRTTAQWAQDLLEMNWNRDVDNRGEELQLADRVVERDGYCVDQGIGRVDFIKIDTDGSDYEVLQGAHGLLRDGGILGLQVEAQFHGAVLPPARGQPVLEHRHHVAPARLRPVPAGSRRPALRNQMARFRRHRPGDLEVGRPVRHL